MLARGLAQNSSLNTFKSLWIDKGDMDVLLSGHQLWPLGRKVKLGSKIAESVIRLAWRRVSWIARWVSASTAGAGTSQRLRNAW